MDEENLSEVAEKSRHWIDAFRTRFFHDYLRNRGRRMAGHSISGRSHGGLKGAAPGLRHVNVEKPGRAFGNAHSHIGMSGNKHDAGAHAEVLKNRGIHD